MPTKAKAKETEEKAEVEVLPQRGMAMSTRQNAVDAVVSLAELQERFGAPVSWQEIEPTFKVIKKDELEGIPFVIAGFRLNDSKQFLQPDPQNPEVLVGNRFVSLLVASYDDEGTLSDWCIVNDGGTGIRDQLIRYVRNFSGDRTIDEAENTFFNAAAAKCPPIKIENGLRPSKYDYVDPDTKKVSKATTWYLS